jgi:hypothetical protein
VAYVALDGLLDGAWLRTLEPGEAKRQVQQVKGLSPFSAELVVVRGANHPDSPPTQERRLEAEIAERYGPGRSVEDVSENWRPHRTWAGLCASCAANVWVRPLSAPRAPGPGRSRTHLRTSLPISRVSSETVDSSTAQLRTCRARCGGRGSFEHRTGTEHDCDDRCGPHRWRPLGEATLRQIHNVLNGAFSRAVKWRWIGVDPMAQHRDWGTRRRNDAM